MKFKELKNLSEKELRTTLAQTRDKLRELRFQTAIKKLRNASQLKELRRVVARILTILQTKQ